MPDNHTNLKLKYYTYESNNITSVTTFQSHQIRANLKSSLPKLDLPRIEPSTSMYSARSAKQKTTEIVEYITYSSVF